QLGIALAEQFTPPTGQEILVIVAHAPGLRSGFRCNIRFRHGPSPIWRCPNTALAADKAARRCDMTRLALKYGWHSARPNPHKYAAALLRESCTYRAVSPMIAFRSEEHTSELQSLRHLVCRLLLEKKKKTIRTQVKTM